MATFLHVDCDYTYFALTEDELTLLEAASPSLWSRFCLVCAPLSVSTGLNALNEYAAQTTSSVTPSLFLNSVIALTTGILALAFGYAWYRGRGSQEKILEKIRQKQRVLLSIPEPPPEVPQSAALPATEKRSAAVAEVLATVDAAPVPAVQTEGTTVQ